jgi:hypothetical protein
LRPTVSHRSPLMLSALAAQLCVACGERGTAGSDGESAADAGGATDDGSVDAEPDQDASGRADTQAAAEDAEPQTPERCTPGTTRCEARLLETCSSDGLGWLLNTCPGGCLDGACVPCAPGALSCDGDAVVRCLDDSRTTEVVETCAAGSVCSDGACIGCAPGARRCDAHVSEVCGEDGVWTAATDCASRGLTCNLGNCVPACSRDPKARTNAGCEYWAVDLDNNGPAVDAQFAVIVSNLGAIPAFVTVWRRDDADAAPEQVLQREIGPSSLEVLALPARNMSSAGTHWAAWRVTSTAPVVAYQFNPLENVSVYSNDATLLLPVDTFATEFIVLSRMQTANGSSRDAPPFRGAFDVVAAGSATTVTVTPTVRTQAGGGMPAMTPNRPYTFTLEPFQVLNIKSDFVEGDLTGTIVTADKPIGVFGSHEGAGSARKCCVDHLEHQLYPVSTWGTHYIASRTQPRGLAPDYWRVVAAEAGTRVTFEPASVHAPITLERGKFIDFASTADFRIIADKPVMVGQILASSFEIVDIPPYGNCLSDADCADGYSCRLADRPDGSEAVICAPDACPVAGSTETCPDGHVCACPPGKPCSCQLLGDPSLILVPPTSQFRDSYVFLAPNKYAFDFINVVAPTETSVTLDGAPVPPTAFVSLGPDWKVARVPVGDGVHRVDATAPVGVIAYGFDDDVSYGYAAGLNLVDRTP